MTYLPCFRRYKRSSSKSSVSVKPLSSSSANAGLLTYFLRRSTGYLYGGGGTEGDTAGGAQDGMGRVRQRPSTLSQKLKKITVNIISCSLPPLRRRPPLASPPWRVLPRWTPAPPPAPPPSSPSPPPPPPSSTAAAAGEGWWLEEGGAWGGRPLSSRETYSSRKRGYRCCR